MKTKIIFICILFMLPFLTQAQYRIKLHTGEIFYGQILTKTPERVQFVVQSGATLDTIWFSRSDIARIRSVDKYGERKKWEFTLTPVAMAASSTNSAFLKLFRGPDFYEGEVESWFGGSITYPHKDASIDFLPLQAAISYRFRDRLELGLLASKSNRGQVTGMLEGLNLLNMMIYRHALLNLVPRVTWLANERSLRLWAGPSFGMGSVKNMSSTNNTKKSAFIPGLSCGIDLSLLERQSVYLRLTAQGHLMGNIRTAPYERWNSEPYPAQSVSMHYALAGLSFGIKL